MFKVCLVLMALSVLSEGRPTLFGAPVAYTGLPLASSLAYTGPGFVTATSSQYFARNYNGVVSPYVAAPYVAAPFASTVVL